MGTRYVLQSEGGIYEVHGITKSHKRWRARSGLVWFLFAEGFPWLGYRDVRKLSAEHSGAQRPNPKVRDAASHLVPRTVPVPEANGELPSDEKTAARTCSGRRRLGLWVQVRSQYASARDALSLDWPGCARAGHTSYGVTFYFFIRCPETGGCFGEDLGRLGILRVATGDPRESKTRRPCAGAPLPRVKRATESRSCRRGYIPAPPPSIKQAMVRPAKGEASSVLDCGREYEVRPRLRQGWDGNGPSLVRESAGEEVQLDLPAFRGGYEVYVPRMSFVCDIRKLTFRGIVPRGGGGIVRYRSIDGLTVGTFPSAEEARTDAANRRKRTEV